MKSIIYLSLLFLLTASMSFSQVQQTKLKHHAFSGTLVLGVEGGATFGLSDYSDLRPDFMGRGMIEYFLPSSSSGTLGIRAFGSAAYVGGWDEDRNPIQFRSTLSTLGGGISYTFSIQDAVFPYLFVGASNTWFSPKDKDDKRLPYVGERPYNDNEINYHGELGMRFLLSNEISLNFSIGAQLSENDNWDNLAAGGNNDILLHTLAGMSYALFTKVDSDGDGITDDVDQCPDTPAGVKVDEFGCPLDEDKDGVPDHLDRCPNTPPGFEVDEFGCIIDSDKDGVADKLDKCPNTPPGAQVNAEGCPDTDGDGVFDNVDKCPDTPKGAPVEIDGCPKDSDKDGVPDYKDECPNTPVGKQVDEKGCAAPDTVVKEITLRGDTNFEFNKAELLPAAYPVLNELAATMKKNLETRWRIEGHTDAIGSDSYNMDLSRRRAESVLNYLLTQGIDRSRIEVLPLGESVPIATNDTQEGRAMNRRVEIKLIEK